MIEIIKAPKENEVFQNSSSITIHVRSVSAQNQLSANNYYFNLQILVDGQEYDVQELSKYDDENASFDLQNIILDVFNQPFTEPIVTEIVPQTNLLKQVQLVVKEFEKATNVEQPSLSLPPFYICNSEKLENTVLDSFQFLSIYDSYINAPLNGVISLPFFSNKTVAIVLTHQGQQTPVGTVTDAQGIYKANIFLADYNVKENETLILKFIVDNAEYVKKINIQPTGLFTPNKLAVLNNFNAWELFYTFGNPIENHKLKPEDLKLTDEQYHRHNVIDTEMYSLNTGRYYMDYQKTVNTVLKSLEIKYWYNNSWVNCLLKNSKTPPIDPNGFISFTKIDLQNNQELLLNNSHQFKGVDSLNNITEQGFENLEIEVLKDKILNAYIGLPPTHINILDIGIGGTLSIVTTQGTTEVTEPTSVPLDSFIKITLSPGGYGDAYRILLANLSHAEGNSNTAKITFDVLINDPNNLPPVINVSTEFTAKIDELSRAIPSDVFDPEGEEVRVWWRKVSGPQITTENTTTTTLLVKDWATVGEYVFEITAQEVLRKKITTQLVKLNVMNYRIELGVNRNEIKVYNGKNGEKIDVYMNINNSITASYTGSNFGNSFDRGNSYSIAINSSIINKAHVTDDGLSNGTNQVTIEDDISFLNFEATFNNQGVISIPINRDINTSKSRGSQDYIEKSALNLTSIIDIEIIPKTNGILPGNLNSLTAPIYFLND